MVSAAHWCCCDPSGFIRWDNCPGSFGERWSRVSDYPNVQAGEIYRVPGTGSACREAVIVQTQPPGNIWTGGIDGPYVDCDACALGTDCSASDWSGVFGVSIGGSLQIEPVDQPTFVYVFDQVAYVIDPGYRVAVPGAPPFAFWQRTTALPDLDALMAVGEFGPNQTPTNLWFNSLVCTGNAVALSMTLEGTGTGVPFQEFTITNDIVSPSGPDGNYQCSEPGAICVTDGVGYWQNGGRVFGGLLI